MFRWYRNAARCYVYLLDVSIDSFARNDQSFHLLQFQQSEPLSAEFLEEFDYSARFWTKHARLAEKQTEELSQLALELLSRENPAYLNWLRIFDPERPRKRGRPHRVLDAPQMPLYYAALSGLTKVTDLLLGSGVDINTQGGGCGNALQATSRLAHQQTVSLLLHKGANVNAQGGHFDNALQAASIRGHEQILKMLLDRGAKVNMQGGYYGNALQAASARGHKQIIKLLLDQGADINAQGGAYSNALQAASVNNYHQVITLLLDQGANVDYLDNIHVPLKHLLAFDGNTDLLRKVLEHYHADRNLVDFQSRTTLQLAARGGHIDTFQYLIGMGFDHLPEDAMGNSLLHQASSGGSLQVVNAVLDMDPMPLSRSGHWSPLHWACRAGNVDVVERLIKAGFRGECVTLPESDVQWSPLAIAISHGKWKMLEELSAYLRSTLDAGDGSGIADAMKICGGLRGGGKCKGCFHVIYGTVFECSTCVGFNYCFMFKPFVDHLHEDHEWACYVLGPPMIEIKVT